MDLPNIPIIPDLRVFFLKTLNGTYYQPFIEGQYISLYKTDEKALNLFQSMNAGDLVLIPSLRNKQISIGQVSEPALDKTRQIVRWLKEIPIEEWDIPFHKLFYSPKLIQNITIFSHLVERKLYSIFSKKDVFHIIFKVKQTQPILGRWLFGFQSIFFDHEIKEDCVMKVNVQSPGIIELISGSIDVVLVIIKIISIFQALKDNDLEADFLKESTSLIEKYHHYHIDQLNLELPKIENNS